MIVTKSHSPPWCGLSQGFLTCIYNGFLTRIPPNQHQDQRKGQFFGLLDSIIVHMGLGDSWRRGHYLKYWLNYCSALMSYIVLVRPNESRIKILPSSMFKIEDQVLALIWLWVSGKVTGWYCFRHCMLLLHSCLDMECRAMLLDAACI